MSSVVIRSLWILSMSTGIVFAWVMFGPYQPADAVGAHDHAASPASAERVKSFSLTADEIRWEIAEGEVVRGWAFNGQIPGPEIRVTEGDLVRVDLTNELPVPTTIHWHGITVPWDMDGVPGLSQEAIEPGETFVYEFIAEPVGTRFFHSHGSNHHDQALQVEMGLYGAFIIEPRDEQPAYDRDYTIVLSERNTALMPWSETEPPHDPHGPETHGDQEHDRDEDGHADHAEQQPAHEDAEDHAHDDHHAAAADALHAHDGELFLMNGRIWPDVDIIDVREGERIRIRLINAGVMAAHPMHLHGHNFHVVAVDGNVLPHPIERDTINLAPGERVDIEFDADNPGLWMFHCHDLHHAALGMKALVRYEGYEWSPEDGIHASPHSDEHHEHDEHGGH